MDRKGIFMALGLAGMLALWVMYYGPKPKVIAEGENTEVVDTSAEKTGDVKSLDKPETNQSPENGAPVKAVPGKEGNTEEPVESINKVAEFAPLEPQTVFIKDLYSLTVDPQKGVTGVELFKHRQEAKDKETHIVLGAQDYPSLALTGVASKWQYGKPVVTSTEGSLEIKRPVIGMDLTVVQTFTLAEDYQFKMSFKFVNTGDKPLNIEGLGLNVGNMRPLSDKVGMMAGMDQAVDVYDIEDDGVSTNLFQDISKKVNAEFPDGDGQGSYRMERPEKGFQWIAVKNRYFAWIIDAKAGFVNCRLGSNVIVEGKGEKRKVTRLVTATGFLRAITVEAGSTQEVSFDCYAGPQELGILKKMSHGKKGVMQLNLFMWFKVGWIGFISELMLNGLLWLYSFVKSYGVAIILLTIIVKSLFWRLTNKSTESMKKMSKLSPKVKELNAKYKDNPQVKQQEMMKLYREHGVNPVAGCLPLFLQMPVFIALFNALRGAIELRHSEFLWISDLSQPDTIFEIAGLPIRPLAIAWAVSMFIQQRVVPSTADPTQKKIMMFMPVFMLFVCYGMPSGLTLYWTFSTGMSILQYYLNNKKNDASDSKKQTAVTAATG